MFQIRKARKEDIIEILLIIDPDDEKYIKVKEGLEKLNMKFQIRKVNPKHTVDLEVASDRGLMVLKTDLKTPIIEVRYKTAYKAYNISIFSGIPEISTALSMPLW